MKFPFALRHAAAAATLAGLCLSASPALAGNGKDQLKSVPKDVGGVLVVNVEQLTKSALFQDLFKMVTAARTPPMAFHPTPLKSSRCNSRRLNPLNTLLLK